MNKPKKTSRNVTRTALFGLILVAAIVSPTLANAQENKLNWPQAVQVSILKPKGSQTVGNQVKIRAHMQRKADNVTFTVRGVTNTAQTFTIAGQNAKKGRVWTATWTAPSNTRGTYSITAQAVNDGMTATSPQVTFYIDTITPPVHNPGNGNNTGTATVKISVPQPLAATGGSTVTLRAITGKPADSVKFFLLDPNQNSIMIAGVASTDKTNWTATWSPASTAPNGTYRVSASAQFGSTTAAADTVAFTYTK